MLISHRGNINGRIPLRENEPSYIRNAIHLGYDVEVDVWYSNNTFWLGHDNPEYQIGLYFLLENADKLWCHAKNIEAIVEMKKEKTINCFWHQKDDITLTSKGYIWAYPGKQPIKNSIAVMPEIYNDDLDKCIGICSDYISNY
jgi:hypothetical protein